jgi:coenzyme A diphosphatase NUDT7
MNVSSHIGEPCFPGGKEEPHDTSLYQTALREAEEEVNLKPHQVSFVGFLPPFIIGIDTVKLIYPVVVTLGVDFDSLVLKPNEEVERIFWMPLRIFLGGSDNHLKSLTVKRGTHRMVTNIFWFHNEDENYHYQVFGFTGSICIVLAIIIYNEPTHFPFNCRSIDPSSIRWIGDTKAIIRFRELQLFSNFPSLKSKL